MNLWAALPGMFSDPSLLSGQPPRDEGVQSLHGDNHRSSYHPLDLGGQTGRSGEGAGQQEQPSSLGGAFQTPSPTPSRLNLLTWVTGK